MTSGDNTFYNQTIYQLNLTLQSQNLLNGENYTITVSYIGDNVQRNASSSPVMVSLRPNSAETVFSNYKCPCNASVMSTPITKLMHAAD